MDEWSTLEGLGLATVQLRSIARRGSFSRDDGVSIQFCNFCQENAKHHVVLLTGWDESFIKYGDVISELLEAGMNVYAMDWRSQGLSGRHLLDPQASASPGPNRTTTHRFAVTYVESFDHHLEDLSFFINQVVVGSCGVEASELTCLAHSMGGLLSLTAAALDQRLFQRLVVCSPMIRMKCGMPHAVALLLGRLTCKLGLGKSYAPGQGSIDVSRPITKKLTTDKDRLAKWETIRRAFPIVAMGGMSNRWVVEAIKAQDWFQPRAHQVSAPVLLLEADIDDFVCTSRPFGQLCRDIPNCIRLRYPTTYHEILFEKEWARSHAMKATLAFLKSGEFPEAGKTTVVPPPPLSEEAQRRREKRRRVLLGFCLAAAAGGLGFLVIAVKRDGGLGRVGGVSRAGK
ncbi:unnamed protein product [Scytosiphon promiscuus]